MCAAFGIVMLLVFPWTAVLLQKINNELVCWPWQVVTFCGNAPWDMAMMELLQVCYFLKFHDLCKQPHDEGKTKINNHLVFSLFPDDVTVAMLGWTQVDCFLVLFLIFTQQYVPGQSSTTFLLAMLLVSPDCYFVMKVKPKITINLCMDGCAAGSLRMITFLSCNVNNFAGNVVDFCPQYCCFGGNKNP